VERQSEASLQLAEIGKDDREYAMRLLDAAAVGLSARSLAHELHQYLRQLRDSTTRISQANKRIRDAEISAAAKVLSAVIRELGKTIATIDPILPGSRSIKETFAIDQFLMQFVDARSSTAHRAGVQVNLEGAEGKGALVVRFSRARLLQVVENLFQNSLYWLRTGPVVGGRSRAINIALTETGFVWSDTGPGIRQSIESSIFDPYVSDKPAAEGSGLGLHIASTYLELEGCSIRLDDSRNEIGRRYIFEINLLGAKSQERQRELDVTT
jgi:C4-dicarboxylate-specific signal transduction histidine kinase